MCIRDSPPPHTHSLTVSPTYDLSDFLIESAPLRRQLEQENIPYEYETSKPLTRFCPTKHQLVNCLAARGQWVTSQPKLQLDPPDSHLLMMKGASLHFLFEPMWLLSGAHQGDYLQILQSTMSKLEDGSLKWAKLEYWYQANAMSHIISLLPTGH